MTEVQKRLLRLFLLGLVGMVAGWLLFYQLGRKEDHEQEKKAEARLLPKLSTITRLVLATPSAEVEIEHRGDDWQITKPLASPAENSTIDAMVQQLTRLEQIRRVGKKRSGGTVAPPDDLWLFGLEPPRFTVTLTDDAGVAATLLVGKKNAFDGSIYVKVEGAPDVSQVDGDLEYQVDKSLYQLRDKRLLAFKEDQVERFTVKRSEGEPYTIGREGDGFVILEPRRLPADEAQINGLLSALANVRAKEFVSEKATPEDLERYSLDHPTVRIELTVDGITAELWLTRQRVGKESLYYACRAGGYPILQLGSDWVLAKVDVGLDALRDEHVLRFDRDRVRTLTLVRGDTRLVFERGRDEKDSGDDWRMLQPEPGDADDPTVTGILYQLWSLKAKSIIKEQATAEDLSTAGLESPEIEITIGATDGTPMGVLRLSGEKDGERLASAGQRIDLVEAAAIDDLSFSVADFRERGSAP